MSVVLRLTLVTVHLKRWHLESCRAVCYTENSPDMKMHILLTVLHTFLMELVRRICLNIKTLILGDQFLYPHHLNV